MLILKGELFDVFTTPGGTNKQTGEKYHPRHKIQILDEEVLSNGQTKKVFRDLEVPDLESYRNKLGEQIEIEVTQYVDASRKPQLKTVIRNGG
jgi:hypothetical protein